jgi:hypothetical protein
MMPPEYKPPAWSGSTTPTLEGDAMEGRPREHDQRVHATPGLVRGVSL